MKAQHVPSLLAAFASIIPLACTATIHRRNDTTSAVGIKTPTAIFWDNVQRAQKYVKSIGPDGQLLTLMYSVDEDHHSFSQNLWDFTVMETTATYTYTETVPPLLKSYHLLWAYQTMATPWETVGVEEMSAATFTAYEHQTLQAMNLFQNNLDPYTVIRHIQAFEGVDHTTKYGPWTYFRISTYPEVPDLPDDLYYYFQSLTGGVFYGINSGNVYFDNVHANALTANNATGLGSLSAAIAHPISSNASTHQPLYNATAHSMFNSSIIITASPNNTNSSGAESA